MAHPPDTARQSQPSARSQGYGRMTWPRWQRERPLTGARNRHFAAPLEVAESTAFSLLWRQYQHSSEKPISLHLAMTSAMRASARTAHRTACLQQNAQAMRTCQDARPTPLPQKLQRRRGLKWHPFVSAAMGRR